MQPFGSVGVACSKRLFPRRVCAGHCGLVAWADLVLHAVPDHEGIFRAVRELDMRSSGMGRGDRPGRSLPVGMEK